MVSFARWRHRPSMVFVFCMHIKLFHRLCRKKLQEWRESKGISYKRPPMPVKPQAKHTVTVSKPVLATTKGEDEAHSLISAVDRSLADCVKLLGEVFFSTLLLDVADADSCSITV